MNGIVAVIAVGSLMVAAVYLAFSRVGRTVRELRIAPFDMRVTPVCTDKRREAGRTAHGIPAATEGKKDGNARWAGSALRSPQGGTTATGMKRQLPIRAVVLQVVALLRAGESPRIAWSKAADVDSNMHGVPNIDQLGNLLGSRHAHGVRAATQLAVTVGAPLSQVLEAVTDTLVREDEARSEQRAAMAGSRTTARVLLFLPVASAVLGWFLGADPVAVSTSGGLGTAAIALGVLLLLAGWGWTSRLVLVAQGKQPTSDIDVHVVLDLVAASLTAGLGIPRTLHAVGESVAGTEGNALQRVAQALMLGVPWERAWSDVPAGLYPVAQGLRGAWVDGAAPSEGLRATGEELRRLRSAEVKSAAARLGVQLVLPLGLCYLPAFVLVGLIPVMVSLGIEILNI